MTKPDVYFKKNPAETALNNAQMNIHDKLDSIREYTDNYVAQTKAAGSVRWGHVGDLGTIDQMLEKWVIETIEEMNE